MTGTTMRDRVLASFLLVWPDLAPDDITDLSTATDEWDSLAAITLLATLEEEFGVTFSDEDVASMLDFEKVLEAVTRAVGSGEQA